MNLLSLIAATLAAGRLTAGYLVGPPDTAFPGASDDCSGWVYATDGLTCEKVEADYNITLTQFATWNPLLFQLSATCVIIPDYDYCIEVKFESTTDSSIPTTTATTTTSTTTLSIPTAAPDIDDCDTFLISRSNDTCESIASEAGISLEDVYGWNPWVGPNCDWLEGGWSICIGVNTTASSSIPSTGISEATATATSSADTTGGTRSELFPTETPASGVGVKISPSVAAQWIWASVVLAAWGLFV